MSTIGLMYKEPRVFAHDANLIVVGAVNSTWNVNKKIKWPLNWGGITVTNSGAGYSVDDVIILTTTGGASVAARVTVDAIDGAGAVTDYSVTTVGADYQVGNTESDSGAGVFACTISNIDIPNTQEAGCCLYVGAAAGIALLRVIMDSAEIDLTTATGYTAASTITFATVSAGSFLPIMVKQIVGTYAANDVLALYQIMAPLGIVNAIPWDPTMLDGGPLPPGSWDIITELGILMKDELGQQLIIEFA